MRLVENGRVGQKQILCANSVTSKGHGRTTCATGCTERPPCTSHRAARLLTPRGHRRSTKKRYPWSADASSQMRLVRKVVIAPVWSFGVSCFFVARRLAQRSVFQKRYPGAFDVWDEDDN